ncbi:MAG TPA: ankyrin repeat domain-containing protein [bacterium]|nr:ankyrin repeat domain-containing protein [bacterium]
MLEFFDAIQAGDLPKVQALFHKDPKLADAKNGQGLSAVLWARYHDRMDVLEFLLKSKEQPLTIFEAAATGNRKTAHYLDQLDKGLVNSYSVDGFTPLQLACFFATAETVKHLITLGADVRPAAKHASGLTALHAAVANRDGGEALEIVKALLILGADPKARQAGGLTPLHAAAARGSWELALMLLLFGADPRSKDDEGRTPRQVAEDKHYQALLELLDKAVPARS